MERVLQQKLHSPAERGFSYVIGAKGLLDALKLYNDQPKYQRLIIDFEFGEDPDDAYSEIPYEKGANFLLHLGLAVTNTYKASILLTHFDRAHSRRSGCLLALYSRIRNHLHGNKHHNGSMESPLILVLQGPWRRGKNQSTG